MMVNWITIITTTSITVNAVTIKKPFKYDMIIDTISIEFQKDLVRNLKSLFSRFYKLF